MVSSFGGQIFLETFPVRFDMYKSMSDETTLHRFASLCHSL